MNVTRQTILNPGIISVLQTPFSAAGELDFESLGKLIEDSIEAGVDGFLASAVASEVGALARDERRELVREIANVVDRRVPLLVGASSNDPKESQLFAKLAEEVGADAFLVAVPEKLYRQPDEIVSFFTQVSSSSELPLLIQDLEWNGPGLELETIARLKDAMPNLLGLKIETVPAGPKYTAVREAFGPDFFIAGGWAVQQWIEALDRGIDALMPESSMIGVYAKILALYQAGQRDAALKLFHKLLPVLAFTNQEINTSIAFFKRLLVRRGIFMHETMRPPGFAWDSYNRRIADELIDLYLSLEEEVT